MSATWNRTPIRDEQWRPLPNAGKQTLSDEQDTAAGGRDQRTIIDSAPALGRVALKVKYNRIYAELRWQSNCQCHSRYLGQVAARSRAENLTAAWQLAKNLGLVSDTSVPV
ncbi:hypothetical protein ACNO8X_27205 [Mycobacterium sp. PDNC021]|uniref:hypothetical protein n=1 Tax=Mycobacterium sp. PDNC021 TaxID=3391399 RepID=UPI003AB0B568